MTVVANQFGKSFRIVEKGCVSSPGKNFKLCCRELLMQPLCGGQRHLWIVFAVDEQGWNIESTELLAQINIAQPVEAAQERRRIG